jgi:hypothetical protein
MDPSTRRTPMSAERHPRSRGIATGDWIDVHVIGGGTPRHGQVLEVLGHPGHEHYRVRGARVDPLRL